AMESLVTLPGVGRKCANVVLGRLGNAPAIIVDTHFGRVVRRVGLTTVKNPTMVERQIGSLLPSELHYRFSMIVNLHGRTTCQARKAFCDACSICHLCESCSLE
ncbi:MAG: endonuclease III, partial [Sphaerochaetaceae bacterium]|nr:endonuclease III [Sphaerochaetaceae bacterium]